MRLRRVVGEFTPPAEPYVFFPPPRRVNTASGPWPEKKALLKEAITQSPIISTDLVPTVLRDFGLTAALKDWTEKLSTPVLRHLHDTGLSKRLEPAVELNVFRIVQALLGNVLVHSGASETHVLPARTNYGLSILVEDNGRESGEPEWLALEEGTGLKSARSRAALMNGKVSVESGSVRGALVRVYLPLPR